MMVEDMPESASLPTDLVLRPTWVKDDLAYFCACCQKEFTFLLRKHHCRHCGKVFCDECSRFKAKIPSMGFNDMVRICEYCRRDVKGLIGPNTWQRASTIKNCHGCTKQFGGALHKITKYHCSNCGEVFCDDCTRWYAKIESLGFDKEYVRVCLACKDTVGASSRVFEWQRDGDCPSCNQCQAPFTTTLRRHHCRYCGRIYCVKCLPGKAHIQGLGKPEKICLPCMQRGGSDLDLLP
eukprot:TRINITY_DN5367_c0_g1_i1.p1 TRINITY_DN5367_c0_g1~~TRINITY_DN5367_c0_g1_i1.p1  ORF type:complete len:251 (-),score=3.85 TRINITY_DN5367_c0_g1_i1:209-919(-)